MTRIRISAEEIIALFGEETARRLIFHCGGHKVPRKEDYLRALRRVMILRDYSYGQRRSDIAAKYQVSPQYVGRIIMQDLRARSRLRDVG